MGFMVFIVAYKRMPFLGEVIDVCQDKQGIIWYKISDLERVLGVKNGTLEELVKIVKEGSSLPNVHKFRKISVSDYAGCSGLFLDTNTVVSILPLFFLELENPCIKKAAFTCFLERLLQETDKAFFSPPSPSKKRNPFTQI